MATADARTAYDTDYPDVALDESRSGWLGFAAIMLGFAGTWNLIDGILAISRSSVYVADARYVFGDLRTWGWIITVLGALEIAAALTVLSGSQIARWFGVTAAGVNAIGQLMFLPAYPFWSLAMFATDLLIIFALIAHGGRRSAALE
jgi:hypothetical protein